MKSYVFPLLSLREENKMLYTDASLKQLISTVEMLFAYPVSSVKCIYWNLDLCCVVV